MPSSRNVLLFCTPSFFLLYYAPILAVNLTAPCLICIFETRHLVKNNIQHVPLSISSCWFLVPLTQFIFVFTNTSPAHKLLYRTSLCSNVAGKARPLSVIHGIMSTILLCIRTLYILLIIRTLYILLIFSNSLDDADKWHRSHSMR